MSKHTPGPWTIQDEGPDGRMGAHVVSNEDLICRCEDWDGFCQAQDEANARLIAAAPDLAEALLEILNMPENIMRVDSRITAGREALIKAGLIGSPGRRLPLGWWFVVGPD